MTPKLIVKSVVCLAMLGLSPLASAQGARPDFGRLEYNANCAACHGLKGAGDGYYKPYLTRSPVDLTGLAKANGGVFPYQRMYETIDGRGQVPAHGQRDMPVWGDDYLAKARADYTDVPYDQEMSVRRRIDTLLDYLYRLQR